MTTEVEQSKLNIHVLNQNQYEVLPSVSDTELYIVDPQFQGGKFLASDANGDIVEKDALTGATINGTDLSISDNKVIIPIATNTNKNLGVVKGDDAGYGIYIHTDGQLRINPGDWGKFQLLNGYLPIVVKDFLLGMKKFLGTTITSSTSNSTWNDTEKEAACETLGATQTEIVDWIES